MSTDVFELHVQKSLQKLEELWQRSGAISLPDSKLGEKERQFSQQQQQLLQESLSELSASIEELQLASEVLRKQNEELLLGRQQIRQERQYYRELFDLAPDCYIITSKNGTIEEINQKSSQLLQVPASYLYRKALAVFIDLADRQQYYTKLNQLKTGKIASATWNFQIVPRGRESIFVECSVFVRRDFKGEIDSFCWRIAPIGDSISAENSSNLTAVALDRLRPSISNLIIQIEEAKISDRCEQSVSNRLENAGRELLNLKGITDNIHILEFYKNRKNSELSLVDYGIFIEGIASKLYSSKVIDRQIIFKKRVSCVGINDTFLLEKLVSNFMQEIDNICQENTIIEIDLNCKTEKQLSIRLEFLGEEIDRERIAAIASYLTKSEPERDKTAENAAIAQQANCICNLNLAAIEKCLHLLQGRIRSEKNSNIIIKLPLISNTETSNNQ